jgi:L-ascorbate metabolism protein UlaG (beta-lactamase superfamily)
MTAYVVFHEHGNHWLDPLLHPRFRHCFVVVPDPAGYWIRIDGMDGRVGVEVVAALDFDIKSFYEGEDFTVVEVNKRGRIRLPITLTNCVGMVKTVLGINAPWVWTPYQLHRNLTR